MKEKFYFLVTALIFISSLYFYNDFGKKLTPYSVSVRGYYRSDGTYVSPHNRRPPGSVEKDAPYELSRGILIVILLGSGGFILGKIYIEIDTYLDNKKKKLAIKNLSKFNLDNVDIEERIKYAIQNKLQVTFFYTNSEGIKSERVVMPNIIGKFKGTYCVRGYCHMRKEYRSFALSRIKNLKILSS